MAKPSVVIYGPQASGKTRNAAALAHHFGLRTVYEADNYPCTAPKKTGTLILTNRREFADEIARELQVRVYDISSLKFREVRSHG